MWDLKLCKRDAKSSMATALRSKEIKEEEKKMNGKKLEKVGFLGFLNHISRYFGKYRLRSRKIRVNQNLGRYGPRFWGYLALRYRYQYCRAVSVRYQPIFSFMTAQIMRVRPTKF